MEDIGYGKQFIHKKYNAGFTSWAKDDTKLKIINEIEEKRDVI